MKAYKAGTTATLVLAITNTVDIYINVTGANVIMDWGSNYPTASSISATSPVRINLDQQGTITISFPVPTSVTNLVTHGFTGNINYTRPCGAPPCTPTPRQFPFDGTNFAVYSSDQAGAMSLMQQLGLPSTSGSPICSFGIFKTAEGTSLCFQAAQQASQGAALYSNGNFTGAKTTLQNAVSLWNQALSAESSKGASLELGTTVGGYGSLLLGIGAIIGGIAATVYALKRRESRYVAAPATH